MTPAHPVRPSPSDESAVRALLEREFPSLAHLWEHDASRRDLLRVMGASLALAGLGACTRQPPERIHPQGRGAAGDVPGVPLDFATAMPRPGGALGLLARTHEGRPTKLEGNPDHPASRGATDARAQAAVLTLYDPERSPAVLRAGRIDTWRAFRRELRDELAQLERGEGLRVLTGAVHSPTLHAQLEALRAALPEARWHRYEPVHRDAERAGARIAFGRDVATHLHLERARVVVALDADLVGLAPDAVRHGRALGTRRTDPGGEPRRMVAFESAPSLTGAFADHRVAMRPSHVERVARLLARELGLDVPGGPELPDDVARLARAAAGDLAAARGASAVACGAWASPATHAIAHAINARLGNLGATVELTEPAELLPAGADDGSDAASLAALAADALEGRVRVLAVLGGNPAYDAPADVDVARALGSVRCSIHLGTYADETARACRWHVPEAHFLESWSDARGPDGTVGIVQPAIAPLHGGRTAHEVVAALAGEEDARPHALVQRHWRDVRADLDDAGFDRFWREALHDGVVPDTRLAALDVSPRDPLELPAPPPLTSGDEDALELAFRPDASVWDGRFANNAWLQELPRPLTRIVWDNAALLAPALARRLGVETGDVLELTLGERAVRAPALVQPGHPDGAVTVHLGYGRTAGGEVGRGVGFDAYPLRTAAAPWSRTGLRVRATGERRRLVSVQDHQRMEGHDLARRTHVGAGAWHRGSHEEHPSLYPPRDDAAAIAWGMVIDLGACTGCNACMAACQAENNVPVVGVDEVAKGREMHWIRVDVYAEGDEARPDVIHQPVPCMHCELAPCEVVCPVGATVHSAEGLNDMVYNRCVGTRYCSNNCPYKVRRFNFHRYAEHSSDLRALGRNPDVTVRTRGVMEKCTYCVQRISAARAEATLAGRELDGADVRTACQAACPTRAIEFGDLADPESAVARKRRLPHHYALLEELGTRPRTTYLARVDNPTAGPGAR
jgi:molybdopterin-containing oxidoreductase family iron-sulfur binding subunit